MWESFMKKNDQDNELVKSEFYKEREQEKTIIESQFVFSLYNNTELYFDYEVKPSDFNRGIWRFYYRMLSEMVEDRK